MRRQRMTLVATAAVALLFLLTMGAPRASADITSYTLTTGNSGGLDCCSGPYATVTVNLTSSTTATITFDSLTNGGYTYLLGSNNAVAVNVNATTWSVGAISGTIAFSPLNKQSLSDGGAATMDGFGSFNQSISAFDGYPNSWTEIVFTLTDTSGTWSSAANVLSGGIAADHGFACVAPCTVSEGAFATGYAGNAVVPDGGMTVMLLGGALVGLATVRRRFRE
jgi:hypothetical protein